jgi:hypothetical protein
MPACRAVDRLLVQEDREPSAANMRVRLGTSCSSMSVGQACGLTLFSNVAVSKTTELPLHNPPAKVAPEHRPAMMPIRRSSW